MVDNDELEKIAILKSTNSAIITTLEDNYNILKARYQTLQDESGIQKKQLTEALLSKDKIRNERDDLTSLVFQLQASQSEARMLATLKAKEEVRPVAVSCRKSPSVSSLPSIRSPPKAFDGRPKVYEDDYVHVSTLDLRRSPPRPESKKSTMSKILGGFNKK